MRVVFLGMVVTAMASCRVDPLYCDQQHACMNPDLPFCDVEGIYPASEGHGRTCIPSPFDAGIATGVRVSLAGTGSGSVASMPSGISCPPTCIAPFPAGAEVQLQSSPSEDSSFLGWSNGCTGTDGCAVTVGDAVTEVTGTFGLNDTAVALRFLGDGSGRITSQDGRVCTDACTLLFPLGSSVSLSAGATTGDSQFSGWSGACSGTAPTCVLDLTGAASVDATFLLVHRLSIAIDGMGTVTSAAPVLSCSMPSCGFDLYGGTSLTLTASPGAGATFQGWSGACSGTGTCQVTMSTDQSVTATFN